VTTIDSAEFDIRGTLRAEDLINTLPQAFGAQGSALANGSTGTASINLRGLGSARTLTLMNGRRLPYGSLNTSAPDVNTIPSALVKRVDVLTGGASATYGSDAISGVVNFVLDDDFEGLQFDTNYSFYQHKNDNDIQSLITEFAAGNPSQYRLPDGNVIDGESIDINAIMGGKFDNGRGHMSAYAGFQNTNEVLQADRDYSVCALGTRNAGSEFTCSGSSTNQFTNLLDLSGSLPEGFWARVNPNDGTFEARDFVTDTFNFNPFNHFQRPSERYNFGAFANYDITENMNAYTELMFVNSETNSQIAPSGVFGYGVAGGNGGLNCDNPFLSAQQTDYIGCSAQDVADGTIVGVGSLLALRRNVEGGPRNQDIKHQTFRGVMGLRGDLANTSLGYDVYASFANVSRSEVYNNDLSIRNLSNALYAVDDGTGNIVCAVNNDADPVNDDPNCVPYDIWSGNAPDPAAVTYIVSPQNRNGDTTQTVVSGKLFGSLGDWGIQFPSAEDAPAFAVGAEYRRDSLDSNPDAAFQSGDGAGQGGPTNAIAGSQEVYDIFAELNVPLIQGVAGADHLGFDLAYRKSFYDKVDSDSYKVGLDWAPTSDLRLRGSYQRAVRAANIFELFATQSIGLFDLDGGDPCGALPGATPEFTQAQCANTGLDPAFYGGAGLINPAGQYNTFGGGNPDLEPEESDTYTFGVVFTPSFIEGLTMSVDYFDITVDGYINTVPESTSLRQCGLTGDAFFCSLVNRGTGGTLWAGQTGFITATNVNTGSLETKGFDILGNYTYDMDARGSLALSYVGTILDELSFQALPDASVTPSVDCAGTYGGACQNNFGTGSNPEYRHKTGVTWSDANGKLAVTGTWRHFAEVDLQSGDGTGINAQLDSQNYLDLAARYNLFENTAIRAGVNNVTDEDPPLSSVVGTAPGNGNTYPQVYDALGRYIFVGATVDF
jgi:outer membrane receptor protein involved in Fe transport